MSVMFKTLDPSTTVSKAFEIMEGRGQSAILVPDDDMFRLVTAGEIVVSAASQDAALTSIRPLRYAVPFKMLRESLLDARYGSSAVRSTHEEVRWGLETAGLAADYCRAEGFCRSLSHPQRIGWETLGCRQGPE